MRGLLKAVGETTRKVYVADTFSPPEMPPPFGLKIVLGVVLSTSSPWPRCRSDQRHARSILAPHIGTGIVVRFSPHRVRAGG